MDGTKMKILNYKWLRTSLFSSLPKEEECYIPGTCSRVQSSGTAQRLKEEKSTSLASLPDPPNPESWLIYAIRSLKSEKRVERGEPELNGMGPIRGL